VSWTFIGMLLLVVGLIAANLALLKHGSKKNQRPLARAKQSQNNNQQQKVQASASTAPAVTHNNDKMNDDAKPKDVLSTANNSDGSDDADS